MSTPNVNKKLIQTAMQLGASAAESILTADIVVQEDLANLCNGNPPCESYGLSPSCPPHISGPDGFLKLQQCSRDSIVIRLDAPSAILFSNQRREVMQLLHYIVAQVQEQAIAKGLTGTQGFAGGSCKKIFCFDHLDCPKLSDQNQCRYPQQAKPSMSGFGINVVKMLQTAGWDLKPTELKDIQKDAQKEDVLSWVAGLVVLCKEAVP